MLFSSIFFIFYFLPVVLFLYYAVPKKAKNTVLLIASIIFYSWGEPVYVFLMIFSAIFNYFMAIDITREKKKGKKATLIFTVVMNLLILGFFKYYGFLLDTVGALFGININYTPLPLPIGISFYTFQAMSYIFDVYRNNVKVQINPLKFTLYLSLFPQLIAGPIVKYKDVAEQLDNRVINLDLIGQGVLRFIIGLGKKVILANSLGALFDTVRALDSDMSVLAAWLGIAAYTLQIYFDFSGYSDMAIGLGKMMGFHFMENFNYPYVSKSITEFWRRWHISLSTWFREYVYIPLGGNRVKVHRHIINLLIVWGLTGLWHGASWNFVAWGLYYGVLLILEKYVFGKYMEKAPVWVRHIYTMVIVMIGWVFFSIESISEAGGYLADMFFLGGEPVINSEFIYLLRTNLLMVLIASICAGPRPYRKFMELLNRIPVLGMVLLFGLFIITIAFLIFSSYNPFLYFRF